MNGVDRNLAPSPRHVMRPTCCFDLLESDSVSPHESQLMQFRLNSVIIFPWIRPTCVPPASCMAYRWRSGFILMILGNDTEKQLTLGLCDHFTDLMYA